MPPPPPLPPSLFPADTSTRLLGGEIAAATGCRLAAAPGGGLAFRAGGPAAALLGPLLGPLGRRGLAWAPGPLLSPYDGPATGFASLRLTVDGRPFGGTPLEADLGERLRRHRLFGANRFPPGAVPEGLPAGRPALALVEPDLAAAPRRLRAFLARARAAHRARASGDLLIAAGPGGVPGALPSGIAALRLPADPFVLFERVATVYVATPEGGCEARLAGCEAVCTAEPEAVLSDAGALLARRYGAGIHYFDPWTRRPLDPAEAVERVAWLRDRFAGNGRRVVYVGISRWKRPALDVFARGPGGDPVHVMTAEDAVAAGRRHGIEAAEVRAWATRAPAQLGRLCAQAGLPLARVEDGFLRSVGLGASLQPGASIVVDDAGIYYDPRSESRLARILKDSAFEPALLARARALREAIVARRLSKYNVGLAPAALALPADRRIVLVPGQVEDDASVQYGSPQVRSNLALLRAARGRNPDAYLLYKPHPDVEAGFRPGAIPEHEARALADAVVGGLAIVDLLDRVHHVETMTSLAGFEALIRGLTVAAHGRPFYAGWGLTEDLAPGADRGRRLSLDALAAGALILYPRYLDPVAMKPCEPEQLLDRLAAARDAAAPSPLAIGALRQRLMRTRYRLLDPIVRRLRARRGVGGAPR